MLFLLIGRVDSGFLTIGIPSIKREGDMGRRYLMATLSSIIESTSAKDKTEIVVLVFLADVDAEYNAQVLDQIIERFSEYLDMGFMQVVQVSKDFYPQLKNLKRNFNDDVERVHWRAKQVMDFAFMFLYSRNISSFYLQIEDDVICARNFLPAVQSFITQQKSWAVLEFSELGFIGKLFKSDDLEKLARYMMTFYDEQPVDWLITYFRLSMAQKKVIMRKPTLFQHVGLKSSFDTSKDNHLKDRFFAGAEKKWEASNPPATIITQIRAFEKYTPDLAYGSLTGFFWASGVSANDSIYVIFEKDEDLDRVIIETGNDKHPRDVLENGWLEASSRVISMDTDAKTASCENLHRIADFHDARVEVENLGNVLAEKTRCLRIVVGQSQTSWVIFNQIAVYTKQ
ncbi:hypothetical protein CAPTEDRAFT_116124 [Capitella teleta]|uniref:Alpha-1,3-mannosyl-glycoprotein 4-beta-N-acetylglucosaminyltransferase C n=1 Tax=Capitella teleta TaxID=283909 RepID=R7TEE9_CAPTE|nr:hypothetical protein CAPTEDRAFT_116124 [Capitella teleta]|eukprot:ELT89847.1 hypothetical protein CAPTEDRAFT_116124 [Capitella teleta]